MFKLKKVRYFLLSIISIIYLAFVFIQSGQNSAQDIKTKMEKSDVPGRADIFMDPERVQLLSITTEKISERALNKIIRTVGIVDVDETKISYIQTKFVGWIEELFVNFIGMPVKQGQPLFSVYSQELFASQEEYLIALQDLEVPVSGKFKEEFKRASMELLKSAHDRLVLWDISEEQVKQLRKDRRTTKVMKIYSPCDGIVLDKKAFIGMNVGPGLITYTIANLSHVSGLCLTLDSLLQQI